MLGLYPLAYEVSISYFDCVEILEALSGSSPMSVITTMPTNTQTIGTVSVSVSSQFTTEHYTSSVPSVVSTTTSITQLPQGEWNSIVLTMYVYTYIMIDIRMVGFKTKVM